MAVAVDQHDERRPVIRQDAFEILDGEAVAPDGNDRDWIHSLSVEPDLAGVDRHRGFDPVVVYHDILEPFDGVGLNHGTAGPERRDPLGNKWGNVVQRFQPIST